MKNKDPRDFGYFMPGEWHDHEACWMAWPARVDLWPDIEATKKAYCDVANTIAEFEPLKLVVRPSMIEDAKKFTSSISISMSWTFSDVNFFASSIIEGLTTSLRGSNSAMVLATSP